MELDKAISERVNGITTTDALKKELVTLYGSLAESKETQDKIEKAMAAKDAEVKAAKDAAEKAMQYYDEIKKGAWNSKFGVEKGSGKEETLYKFGSYLKGLATGNRELIKKFGEGGMQLTAQESDAFGDSTSSFEGMIRNKANIGTPLYSDSTTGSYLVPVDYTATVMYVAKQTSQMMSEVTEYPMSAITRYVPTQLVSFTMAYKSAQSAANAEVDPTFGQATLTTYNYGGFIPITEEFAEDSLVAVGAYFRDIIGQAWGYQFDYECLQDTGSPVTGIFSAATNVKTMSSSQTTADSIKVDDLYDTIKTLTTVMKRINAKWMLHVTVFDVIRKIKDANGNYIYQQPSGNQPAMLCGYPYIISDGATPATSVTAGTRALAFGNPKYFLYGNRIPLEIKFFDQMYANAQYNTSAFRARARAAFTVGVASAFAALKTAAL